VWLSVGRGMKEAENIFLTCVIAKIRFYKNEKNEPILKSSQTLDFTVK